jgi:hypothetical protein
MAYSSSIPPAPTHILPATAVHLTSSSTSAVQDPSPPVIPLDTTPVTLTPYAGEYFNIWKFQVQCIFRSRHLLDIIEGCEVFDPAASFAHRQYWLQHDQQAMDILVQTMNRKYLHPFLNVRSSREMWIQLLLHYDKRATTTVHGLQKKFFDLKPVAGKGIRSFLSEVNNVNDQLRELDLSKAFEEDALMPLKIQLTSQNLSIVVPLLIVLLSCRIPIATYVLARSVLTLVTLLFLGLISLSHHLPSIPTALL